jgi:hypothetical protein
MTMLATQTSKEPTRSTPSHDLDSLARLSLAELDALYRSATVPSTMHVTDGALRGRMLAIRGMPRLLGTRLAAWAAAPSFVWEGKTFEASSDTRGVGHNRVRLQGVLGRQNLFPFATSFGPSAIDGKPTLVLDYDLDVNPSYIRRIHDEIREVAPRLLLGPAMLKRRADKVLVLWFALDARFS